MNTIDFASPVWDSKEQSYRIYTQSTSTLSSAPQFIDLSSNNVEIEYPELTTSPADKFIKAFIQSLLSKDAKEHWFSTRLRESSILRKLEHVWDLNPSLVPTHPWVIAIWSIHYLQINTKGFIVHWKLVRFEETHPQISSRFLPILSSPGTPRAPSPSLEAETRQFTIQPTAELDLDGLEAVYDIPFTNERAVDLDEQLKDQNALHEARLRLALAKLKAERLRNTYYSKYGEAYSEGEDSDLSESDSEEEH